MSMMMTYRELWRRDAAIDQSQQSVKEELRKCERNLQSTASKVNIFTFNKQIAWAANDCWSDS